VLIIPIHSIAASGSKRRRGGSLLEQYGSAERVLFAMSAIPGRLHFQPERIRLDVLALTDRGA
jgi:hypothetical protein